MRVLVITNYLGNLGGLGRYSNEVVKALRAQGVEVEVLSESDRMKPVFNQRRGKLLKNFIHNLLVARREAKRYDIIHAHDGWPFGVYGWWAVLGTKKKLFITGIGTYSIAPLREAVRGGLLRLAYKRAAQVFCISEYVLDRLKKCIPDLKGRVVLMGTTKLPKPSKESLLKLQEKFGLSNHYPIVLTVGDIKNRKGQLDTLKSLYLLKSKYPNFLYVLIGDDADTYYLNLIRSHSKEFHLEKNILIISGMYDDEVLASFYAICDLFMLNSNNDRDHFEGFGLVLLEAAQFGKPVIGSSGCGIESALSNGNNGYLARQGDHEDIAQKVISILEKSSKIFGQNSLEFYKHFSWVKTVKEYYADYIR